MVADLVEIEVTAAGVVVEVVVVPLSFSLMLSPSAKPVKSLVTLLSSVTTGLIRLFNRLLHPLFLSTTKLTLLPFLRLDQVTIVGILTLRLRTT